MSDPQYTRRSVIVTGGAAALAAVAGCSTSSASGGDPTTQADDHDDHEDDHDDETSHADDHDEETSHAEDDHHGADNTHHGETTHVDEHEHEHGELPEEPAHEVTVAMRTVDGGYHFDPHVVWVEAGGTVTFELESGSHTATAYAPANDVQRRIPEGAEVFDSGTVSESGATFEHTFETPGVYDYYCVPHEAAGMIGSVVVGEPDPHDQPGLAEPSEEMPEGAREKIHDLNGSVDEMLGHVHEETATAHDEE